MVLTLSFKMSEYPNYDESFILIGRARSRSAHKHASISDVLTFILRNFKTFKYYNSKIVRKVS